MHLSTCYFTIVFTQRDACKPRMTCLPHQTSLWSTCAPLSGTGRPGTRPIARSASNAPSTTGHATSRPAGSSYRPLSPRSRSCSPSPSWMAIRKWDNLSCFYLQYVILNFSSRSVLLAKIEYNTNSIEFAHLLCKPHKKLTSASATKTMFLTF